MPCYDPGPPPKSDFESKIKIDNLTAMLCKTCSHIEEAGDTWDFFQDNKDIGKWWRKHKEFDLKRRKEIKIKALAKLNEEEKEVIRELGI